MLAGLPLSIAEKPDAGAVNQQVQGAIDGPIRHLDGQRSMVLRGPTGATSHLTLPMALGRVIRHTQSRFAIFNKLASIVLQ